MRITEFPQFIPSRYDRIAALRRELARYATYAQTHGDSYLTDWLTEATNAMKAQMPNGTTGNVET
jgi:hypothetical protein